MEAMNYVFSFANRSITRRKTSIALMVRNTTGFLISVHFTFIQDLYGLFVELYQTYG